MTGELGEKVNEYEVGSSGCAGLPMNETDRRNWKIGDVEEAGDAVVALDEASSDEVEAEEDEEDANVLVLALLSSLVVE